MKLLIRSQFETQAVLTRDITSLFSFILRFESQNLLYFILLHIHCPFRLMSFLRENSQELFLASELRSTMFIVIYFSRFFEWTLYSSAPLLSNDILFIIVYCHSFVSSCRLSRRRNGIQVKRWK
jgi:hypothetical protein